MSDGFERDLEADERFERRLFWWQLAIVLVVAAVIVVEAMLG
ncbi:hypothetical protein OM076_19790 [Solirubrobacter ginsenosidimutans]|uniref:Uncharacterized protein n=1 Tax=Solirubrobacter ginsenosidimutans TaxID=490573 RepID=A0A9X3S3W3_9ACTN|nr:hypothetical protein [Solirubrobacter ginsenosidimutans]MDA0162526.1 hypothetical protein [Solirubrobacter ginsenosidimutans]